MNDDKIILYRTDDGQVALSLYARDGSVWMNQSQLAELFATSVPNISMHISNVLQDKELSEISVVQDYLTTATDGKEYSVAFYAQETAELRAKNRATLTMDFWRENVDRLITFNDKPLLSGKGRISHEAMEQNDAVIAYFSKENNIKAPF